VELSRLWLSFLPEVFLRDGSEENTQDGTSYFNVEFFVALVNWR
jgi:hypothetical protein